MPFDKIINNVFHTAGFNEIGHIMLNIEDQKDLSAEQDVAETEARIMVAIL